MGALIFILFQTFMLLFAIQLPGMGNVSYLAHLGGAMVGVAFGYAMMKKGVEAPKPGSKLGKKLDNLDYTPRGELAYSPANKERYQALVAEDIPEVKDYTSQAGGENVGFDESKVTVRLVDLEKRERSLFDIAARAAASLAQVFAGKRRDLALPEV